MFPKIKRNQKKTFHKIKLYQKIIKMKFLLIMKFHKIKNQKLSKLKLPMNNKTNQNLKKSIKLIKWFKMVLKLNKDKKILKLNLKILQNYKIKQFYIWKNNFMKKTKKLLNLKNNQLKIVLINKKI